MNRVTLDGLRLTADESVEMMAFTTAQSARLFEAVPDDPNTRGEFEKNVRRFTDNEEHIVKACLAFYDVLYEAYEAMKKDD